jgi:phage-related protein
MAEEELTLRMRTRGAGRTAAEVKAVGAAVDSVDDKTIKIDKDTRKAASAFAALGSAAVNVVARMAVMAAMWGPLLLALGAVAAAVGAVAIAYTAALIPAIGIAVAAMITWEDQVKKTGSEAWKLNKVAHSLKRTFVQTLGPAVEEVFIGIRRGLRAIQPMLATLKGPLKVFGQMLGGAIELFMRGIGDMGPEIRTMLLAVSKLMPILVKPALALVEAFISIATNVAKWLASSEGMETMAGIWNAIKGAAEGLWGILKPLGEIVGEIFQDINPEAGQGAVGVLEGIGKALQFVADHWDVAGPIFWLIVTVLGAMAAAAVVLGISISLAAAPILLVVGAIAALAFMLFFLYKRVPAVRKAIDWLWRALKNVARWIFTAGKNAWRALVTGFNWVKRAGQNVGRALANAWDWVKQAVTDAVQWIKNAWNNMVNFIKSIPGRITSAASGMFDGIKEAFRSAINWLIDKWNGLELGPIAIPLAPDIPAIGTPDVDRVATGGLIRRGGAALVGERGPEIVSLPTGARVHSNQMSQAMLGGGGPTVIEATFITPDGEVLARQTVRAARKKQSTR